MDVSVSIHDILKFYIGTCCYERMQATLRAATPSTEELWVTVRDIREILILVATLMGAFPRKKLEQISRLNRKALALESRLHRVEKLGEDFVMLRQWTRSAQDAQWDVHGAISMLTRGKPVSGLPTLTADLIASAKKPFVVVSGVESHAGNIQKRLHAIFTAKFSALKNQGMIPERCEFRMNEDATIEIRSVGEFSFVGIFDGKRWFIVKATLSTCPAASEGFREVLQAASADCVIQTAFRICARAKIKQWAKEASEHPGGTIYAVERFPLKISLFQSAPMQCSISAVVGQDGDFVVKTEPPCEQSRAADTLDDTIEKITRVVRTTIMKAVTTELSSKGLKVFNLGVGELLTSLNRLVFIIGIATRGNIIVKCPTLLGAEVKKATVASIHQVLADLSRYSRNLF